MVDLSGPQRQSQKKVNFQALTRQNTPKPANGLPEGATFAAG
jgi:hypothetical protein